MTVQEIRDDEHDREALILDLIAKSEQDHEWLLTCQQRADVAGDIADQAQVAWMTSKRALEAALKERGAL